MEQHANPAPTQILKNEHDVILKVLDSFEGMLKKVEEGTAPDPDFFGKSVEFFQGFADGWHHAKEEDCLFPAMEKAGLPPEGGPVGMMLEEHDQGREYVREIKRSIEDTPAEAKKILLDNGWAFLQLLRAHIHKENEILFPLADRAIAADAMRVLSRDFEAAEAAKGEGTREHFLALARDLEAKVGV
jgi:hemerythrin-like domain-containing protein